MTVHSWKALYIPLEDDEGEFVVIVEQWKQPSETEAGLIRLDSEPTIHHGDPSLPFCGGLTRFVKVSETKSFLFCERCGLKISFSSSVETLGELKEHLLNV